MAFVDAFVAFVDAFVAFVGAWSAALSATGSVQPFFAAISRPRRVAGPAEGPSFSWPSRKPARTRSFSLNVGATIGPRVGWMSRPAWMSSIIARAEEGLWLSKNSQLTMTTGA